MFIECKFNITEVFVVIQSAFKATQQKSYKKFKNLFRSYSNLD